jgi:DNA-binding NarL/FixJ family response regulator
MPTKTAPKSGAHATDSPAKGPRFCPHCGNVIPRERPKESARPQATPDLTDRQLEVLRLVASGYNAKEIGKELRISSRTVEFHRGALMQKLGLYSVPELTMYAMANRLIGFGA